MLVIAPENRIQCRPIEIRGNPDVVQNTKCVRICVGGFAGQYQGGPGTVEIGPNTEAQNENEFPGAAT
jgi:hypothetical protein